MITHPLPAIGAVAWDRPGKWRVAGIVEGHVVARRHRGGLQVKSAADWARLLPHEWTEADVIRAEARDLLEMARLPASAMASVAVTTDGWQIAANVRPKRLSFPVCVGRQAGRRYVVLDKMPERAPAPLFDRVA